MKILFICTGNTCRSPMAEGLFKEILRKKDKTGIEVFSAGIAAEEGAPAAQNAVEAMKERGVDISAHRAAQLTEKMLREADSIFVMTPQQSFILTSLYPDMHNISVLSETGIPDPFGQPLSVYKNCAETLEKALINIADNL